MSLLKLKNVGKEYGNQVVLERINAQVHEGEFVTIVGASGCGKTTFLKMLLGTETPTKGDLLLDGQVIPDEPSAERGIVFQRYSVFPHLTVLDNVLIGAEFEHSRVFGWVFGSQRQKLKDQARAMLEQVGLGASLDKYPHQLSGGMQQRLAFAQALLKKPRILLLDEPFGALDPGIRAEMHELITQLWREHRLTIFMITHDLKEAFGLGSRLWVFNKVRHDAQAPDAYGANIVYDIALDKKPAGIVEQVREVMGVAVEVAQPEVV